MKPLTDLNWKLLPDKEEWTKECQYAYKALKHNLIKEPVLHNPDFSKESIVQTDMSGYGESIVLSQLNLEGNDHPISYFRRQLLPREQKYSMVKKNVWL